MKTKEELFPQKAKANKIKSVTKTEALERAYDELMATDPKKVLSYGYTWMDDKIVGMFPGEIILIGGESGTGKTTFANDIMYKATKQGKVALFSLEERLESYEKKSAFFEINKLRWIDKKPPYQWKEFITGALNGSDEFQAYFAQAWERLKNDNLTYEDCGGEMVTIDLVNERIRMLAKQGVKLFLIDHLHYFDLLEKDTTKTDFIERVMIQLSNLIKEIGVTVVLISHYKKLNGEKPKLDSFKDSVAIGQNATTVINIWRNRSEHATDEERNTTFFYIPKTRQLGGEGVLVAKFNYLKGTYEKIEQQPESTLL